MDTSCRRRTLLSVGAIALAGCTSGGGSDNVDSSGDGPSTDHEVEIHDDAFHPAVLRTAVDDRVVWRNTDSGVYTVTAKEGTLPPDAEYFASGGLGSETVAQLLYPFVGQIRSGDTYAYTPTVPGEYEYYSITQQSRGYEMSGTLVVE